MKRIIAGSLLAVTLTAGCYRVPPSGGPTPEQTRQEMDTVGVVGVAVAVIAMVSGLLVLSGAAK